MTTNVTLSCLGFASQKQVVRFTTFALTFVFVSSGLRSLRSHSPYANSLSWICFTKTSRSFHYVCTHFCFCFFGSTFTSFTFALRKFAVLDLLHKNKSFVSLRLHSLLFLFLRVYVHFVHIRPTQIRCLGFASQK